MEEIFESYRQNGRLHHAYCVEAGTGDAKKEAAHFVAQLEKELGIATRGNPDFWHGTFESFGIDESRALKEMQMNRAFAAGAGRKIFIIETGFFTREAQNALLKIFEEPTEGTHFFIFTPSAETLLPTLRSRLVMIRRKDGVANHTADTAANAADFSAEAALEQLVKKFATATKPQRIELVKSLIEDKSKADALVFLNRLEEYFYEKSTKNLSEDKMPSPDEMAFFSNLFKLKGYLSDRSASVKMILEHAALIAPIAPL